MAAKKSPKRKRPSKPKSLIAAEKRIAEIKEAQKKAQAKVKDLIAQKDAIEIGTPDWKAKQMTFDKQIATARKTAGSFGTKLINATNMQSAGLRQYSQNLEKAGFGNLATRIGDQASAIGARVTNLQSNAFLKNSQKDSKGVKQILTGGIAGLASTVKNALPTAQLTGQGIVGMNLGETNTAIYGDGTNKGLIDMMRDSQRSVQQTTEEMQRRQVLALGRNADLTRTSLQSLSPEVARATNLFDKAATRTSKLASDTYRMTDRALDQQSALASKAMNQANNYVDRSRPIADKAVRGYQGITALQQNAAEDAYARARQLNPEQMRDADQAARESFAARGMLGSTGSVASEILNRESSIAARRAEAAGMGQLAQQGQTGLVGLSSGYESEFLGRRQGLQAGAMALSQGAMGAQQSVRGEARQSRGDLYDTGQFYTQYGLPLLTNQTGAQEAGLGVLGAGTSMSGQGAGMLQAGANLGMSKYTTDKNGQNARAGADAAGDAALMSAGVGVAGAIAVALI